MACMAVTVLAVARMTMSMTMRRMTMRMPMRTMPARMSMAAVGAMTRMTVRLIVRLGLGRFGKTRPPEPRTRYKSPQPPPEEVASFQHYTSPPDYSAHIGAGSPQ
jgi:hypothetical protein